MVAGVCVRISRPSPAWVALLAVVGLAGSGLVFGCESEDPTAPYFPTDDGDEEIVDPSFGAVTGTAVKGWTQCEWGEAECTRPAGVVEFQYAELRDHAEILGVNKGVAATITDSRHIQGIQRFSRVVNGVYTDHLVLTRSTNDASQQVLVAEMDRNTVLDPGTRYRANRRFWDYQYGGVDISLVDHAPPAQDKIVSANQIYPGYVEVGGFQIIGNYAFIPFDSHSNGEQARIGVIDVSTTTPKSKYYVTVPAGLTVDSTAVTKLADGTYLLLACTNACEEMLVWRSTGTSLSRNPDFVYKGVSPLSNWISYENIQLVVNASGSLSLIGLLRDDGDDWLDVFRLSYEEGAAPLPWRLTVTKVGGRHMYCGWTGVHDLCDFDAGAGVYVDAFGHLLVYATEPKNDGPSGTGFGTASNFEFEGDSLPIGEFHSIRRIYNPPVTSPLRSYVEIYRDADYKGVALRLDYVDTRYSPWDLDCCSLGSGFRREASSIVWNLHSGVSAKMDGLTGNDVANFKEPEERDTTLVGQGAIPSLKNVEGLGDYNDVFIQVDPNCSLGNESAPACNE